MPAPIDYTAVLLLAKNELELVLGTLRDKGTSRFSKALLYAGAVALAAYVLIYLPPQQKSRRLQAQIDNMKSLAQKGKTIKDTRETLRAVYLGLPAPADREQWLSNSIRDSLATTGLNVEDFRPVAETEANGLIFQESGVTLTMRFEEFFNWLLRVENAKPLLHVGAIDIGKKKERTGSNQVALSLMTVVPKTTEFR